MGTGRGGGQGSPRSMGNNGVRKASGFIESLIRRANGEEVVWSARDDSGVGQAGNRAANKDQSGLNPNRIRGFGGSQSSGGPQRVETPSLNEMKAKQGAIVAKFMTFFKRKSTLVIEMYEACFYRDKPNK